MTAHRAKQIVLMNHTNMLGHHFGCARVMRLIEDALTERGCAIVGRLDGKLNWQRDADALKLLGSCDAIVINGEGTLHHGRKKATWLMEVASHPVTRDKELSLINALYQDNPDSWAPLLRGFSQVYARDGRSAAQMSAHVGHPVEHFGDLSTSAGAMPDLDDRTGILVSDSVRNTAAARLADLASDLARDSEVRLIPLTVSLREENPFKPLASRLLRRWSVAARQMLLQHRHPLLRYVTSEETFLEELRRSRLCVTGRFHGVCMNLVTGTPFITVSSNSWKIEALFEDAGIDKRRLVTPDALSRDLVLGQDWAFTIAEQANIAAFLDRSQRGAAAMFDAIAA